MSHSARRVRAAATVIGALVLVLAGVIAWAWVQGGLAEGFAVVTSNPWGWVTLVDLYLGLAFVTTWIHVREGDWRRTVAWGIALACTGNLATGVYLLWQCRRASSARSVWLRQ